MTRDDEPAGGVSGRRGAVDRVIRVVFDRAGVPLGGVLVVLAALAGQRADWLAAGLAVAAGVSVIGVWLADEPARIRRDATPRDRDGAPDGRG